MTETPSPARVRAEAMFRTVAVTPETKQTEMDEYKAKQAAALANMERLRAMRMGRGKR